VSLALTVDGPVGVLGLRAPESADVDRVETVATGPDGGAFLGGVAFLTPSRSGSGSRLGPSLASVATDDWTSDGPSRSADSARRSRSNTE